MTALTRSQTKRQKTAHVFLPRDILVKVAKHLDQVSYLAFILTCKDFKEVKKEVEGCVNDAFAAVHKIKTKRYLPKGLKLMPYRSKLETSYQKVEKGWIRFVCSLRLVDHEVWRKDTLFRGTKEILLAIAVLNGHSEEIKWLRSQNWPWNSMA